MGKILLAHSRDPVRKHLRGILETEGHWVMSLSSNENIGNRVLSHRPDLILIEATSGMLALIERIRKIPLSQPLPIIAVGKMENTDSVADIFTQSGADALIAEDAANPLEISNTVRSLIEQPPGKKGRRRFFRSGPLELDRDTRSVRLGVAIVTDLPPKHFELIWFLARRATESRELCPRQLLVRKIWKTQVRDREVDVTVSRLKTRLPFLANYIETIPGKGYRLLLPALGSKPAENGITK